jgi:hypothetical protein
MNAPERFDLFQDHPWEPKLIASFGELAAAKAAMEKIASEVPGRYFVWCSAEEETMARLNTGDRWPRIC